MDELLKALNVIKNECRSHEHCDDCPLRIKDGSSSVEGYCSIINDKPDHWDLVAECEDFIIPRLFV